jgi:uncharacterized protein (TIGR02145 family)
MNYSKISGQFVCKMAMLLAFVFAACSEDNSPMNGAHGGAAEEQGYYALAGRLGDVYPKLLLGDSIGDTSSHGNLMLAPKGASIIVYELDSLTFDTTGRSFVGSVDDDEGHFVFNSLDLSSPYVLIDEYVPSRDTCRYVTALLPLEDRCFEYTIKEKQLRAIVDLRKNEKISVNSLTSAKVPLLQGYLAEGMTFAEANQMAERKILEDLGIFEDLGSFEEMFDDDSELSYVNKLVQYTEASVRDGLEWGDVVDNYVSPQKFVGRTQMEKYFQNSKKMIDYKIGFLAKIDGLGQCTEARENDVGEIKVPYRENFVNVVCRSKKWTMGFKPVEYTKGLLVDNRDSKSYKTVTYNWGDVVQTWMAEDLVYADSAHPACDGYSDENICVENGGRYEWLDAMDIELEDVNIYWIRRQGGDTVSYQECLKVLDSIGVFGFSDSTIWDTHDGTCTDGSWDYDYTNSEMRSNLNAHQGICPDGWRIPTTNDWRTLLQNLGEQYGVDYVKAVPVLYDEIATGFGLSSSVVGLGDFHNFFAVADEHLSRVNFFQGYSNGYGFGFNTPTEYQYNENAVDRAPLNGVNVRCIKN